MELLVVLLGEIIAAPFAAALAALLELLAVGLAWLVELLRRVAPGAAGRRGRDPAAPAPAPPRRPAPTWLRRSRWTLLALAGATLLLAFVVGTFFVSPVVSWIAGRIQARTGIAMEWAALEGNLFFGALRFEGLALRRAGHELSDFDLQLERCALDMDLLSALSPAVTLREVVLRGVRGTYERRAKPGDLRPRRQFKVAELQIEDLEVRLRDHTVKHGVLDVTVAIARGQSRPMRSEYAVFDALFRSNVDGSVAGRPVRLETGETGGLRFTRWRGEGLPLELAAHWIGGPFQWIRGGRLDVRVDDEWKRGDTISLDCHWHLSLRDIVAEVPEGLGAAQGAAARLAVAWLNQRREPLQIDFDLQIDEQPFRGAAALAQTDFADKVGAAVRATLTKMLGK
jgi:hypothetical protein